MKLFLGRFKAVRRINQCSSLPILPIYYIIIKPIEKSFGHWISWFLKSIVNVKACVYLLNNNVANTSKLVKQIVNSHKKNEQALNNINPPDSSYEDPDHDLHLEYKTTSIQVHVIFTIILMLRTMRKNGMMSA